MVEYFLRRMLWIALLLSMTIVLCNCALSPGRTLAGEDAPQQAQSAAPASPESLSGRVLVVYHADIPDSREVAEYYARQRGIPKDHLCSVSFPAEDVIQGKHYLERVKPGVRQCLEREGAERILYVVLSYRTPFKVMIPGQRFDASMDSLIADIWDQANADPLPQQVAAPHPYYVAHDSAGNRYAPFQPFHVYREQNGRPRIYSVWRLDGPTAAIAKALVDKAVATEAKGGPQGIGCFDRNTNDVQYKADSSYASGEWDIHRASELAKLAGFEVVLDTHPQEFGEEPAPLRCEPAALYAGWYQLNHYNDAFTWSDGAIGLHIDSMSAWHPREGPNWVHNALRLGITITAGAVSEPYVTHYPKVDGIFHDLFQGANVGDAFLRNTRLLKFRIMNVGDPLYRPFPSGRGPLALGMEPSPSVRVRSPRTLGGVQGVAVVRAAGDPSTERRMRLSVHPSELGQVEPELVFPPGTLETEAVVMTAGVEEVKTLRVLADGPGGFASGAIQLMPALARLEPSTQQMPGGSPVDLRLQVGATVYGTPAPVELSTNCARFMDAPSRVMVPTGQDWVQFSIDTKPVSKETVCEVTLSKFGASIRATVVLTPSGVQ